MWIYTQSETIVDIEHLIDRKITKAQKQGKYRIYTHCYPIQRDPIPTILQRIDC